VDQKLTDKIPQTKADANRDFLGKEEVQELHQKVCIFDKLS